MAKKIRKNKIDERHSFLFGSNPDDNNERKYMPSKTHSIEVDSAV